MATPVGVLRAGEATAAAPAEKKSLVAAWYGLAVLLFATVLATVDRQILVLVTEPLKHSLQLSDTQIGLMNGIGLSLVSMLATFPLGWLADRFDRRVLLAVCILVWSVFTAACGLADTFTMLFACSMGIAVGEAVLGPISYAFIPDLFPPDRWITANYIFYVTGVLGGAAGMAFSGGVIGFVDANHASLPAAVAGLDSWRVALIAVAIPGLVIAALVLLIRLRRSVAAHAGEKGGGLVAYLREHARTVVGVFTGFGLVASASGTVGSWIPVVLVREFGQTPAQTGMRLGLVLAIGSVVGVIASALLVRGLRPRLGQVTPLRAAQFGAGAALLFVPLCLLAVDAGQFYLILTAQSAATTCALSLSPTILQYMAPRLLRGRVIALGGLIYVAFLSLSPIVVGAISDLLGHGPRSLLRSVLIVAIPCYAAGAGFLRYAEARLPHTLAAVDPE